jgi:transcriptional regulator GlxA family with amidase domain
MTRPPLVVIVAYPDVQALDVTGPLEVFAMANRFGSGTNYRVEVVGPVAGSVRTSSGLSITPERAIGAVREAVDTLVVAGGNGTAAAVRDDALIKHIQRIANRARRVTSVCSGAFLLAQAGLLDGRRATTHWSATARLARYYPSITVDPEPIFVRDGHVWTSAGVTAGMDLALALVEDDLGPAAALEIARWLVLYLQRPGGQAQFSAHLDATPAARSSLRDVQTWIAEHLAGDLAVPALAGRAGMSTRNFSRAFRREVGVTPADFVESLRVEAARRALEQTDESLELIAHRCGFGTVATMHRAFRRRVLTTPARYRGHFTPVAAS